MHGPLRGLRVLDLTQGIAGPFGTKHLADYGADLMKIEPPGHGDAARRSPPFKNDDPHAEKSGLFLYLNTNKRGITLALDTATGASVFRALAGEADMVVEDLGPGRMESFGLGHETLFQLNSRLSVVSLTSFGPTGPYRDYRLTDLSAFALTGPMITFGEPYREPLRIFPDSTLFYAGLSLANAAMGAAIGGRLSGHGRRVEVSVTESFLANAQRHAVNYQYSGDVPRRVGTAARPQFLVGGYPCADGYVAIQGTGRGESWWPRVFQMMGMPELSGDSRFQNSRAIMENRDEFDDLWYGWLLERTREEVFDAAAEARFPLAPVYSPQGIYEDPHFNDRGFFVDVHHVVAGDARYPGPPFRVHSAPTTVRRAAPVLGEHNDEVYRGMLGLSASEMSGLRAAGVV